MDVWKRTILNENVKTLFDQQSGIEDDQTVTERENVIARASLKKLANSAL